MNKIFVIAGTYEQYKQFCTQLAASMNAEGLRVNRLDIVYVDGAERLRGFSNPWGYKVGTYAARKDINELATIIATARSSIDNDFIEVEL